MPKESNPKESKSGTHSAVQSSTEASEDEDRLLDNILSEGDSYEVLKTASNGGAHFQFRLEKSWPLMDMPVNSRFRLPISSLFRNFTNIPFSERRKLYSSCYSKQNDNDEALSDQPSSRSFTSIKEMDISLKVASVNDTWDSALLSRMLDEFDREWLDLSCICTKADSMKISTLTNTVSLDQSTNTDVAVGKLLNMTITQSNSNQKSMESCKHNLEEWLDSILDD